MADTPPLTVVHRYCRMSNFGFWIWTRVTPRGAAHRAFGGTAEFVGRPLHLFERVAAIRPIPRGRLLELLHGLRQRFDRGSPPRPGARRLPPRCRRRCAGAVRPRRVPGVWRTLEAVDDRGQGVAHDQSQHQGNEHRLRPVEGEDRWRGPHNDQRDITGGDDVAKLGIYGSPASREPPPCRVPRIVVSHAAIMDAAQAMGNWPLARLDG